MKILLALFKYFPFGGLQSDMLRLAREASGRGHEVRLLTTAWAGEPAGDGITVELLPVRGWSNQGRLLAFEADVQARCQALQPDTTLFFNRLRGGDFYFAGDDCLHAHWHRLHHRLTLALHPRYRTFLNIEKAIFSPESATRILHIVERQKAEYQAAYGTPDDRFFLLPPGMNPACRRPAAADTLRRQHRQRWGLAESDLMLIMVAGNLLLKGGDRVLQAVAALPESLRSRCRLFLVGENMPENLRRQAAALGLAGQVECPGPSREIPAYLLAADLMLHPARQEAAGSVLVEALASGLSVVCSAACGFAPYVQAAGGTVLPEPFAQDACNRAVAEALAALPQLRQRVLAYAESHDFTGRAAVAVDILEGKGKGDLF